MTELEALDFCRRVRSHEETTISGAFWIGNANRAELSAALDAGLVWRSHDSDGGYFRLTHKGEALLAQPPRATELPGFAILSTESGSASASGARRTVTDAARVVLVDDQGGAEVGVRVVAAGQTPVGFVRSVRRCDWYPDTAEGRRAFAEAVRRLWGR